MKVVNIEVDGNIKILDVFDTDNKTKISVNSSFKVPSGNYKNIILNFDFISPKSNQDGLYLFAVFNADFLENPIQVEITELEAEGNTYNTACFIPQEVLQKEAQASVGIWGYINGNGSLKKKLSLSPLPFSVIPGSYNEKATEGIIPTPTAFEVYFNNVAEANEQMQKNLEEYNKKVEEKYTEMSNNIEEKYTEMSNSIDTKFEKVDGILENKMMFTKTYESIYITTEENEAEIPIEIDVFNEITPLEVFINGIRKSIDTDYTIDYTNKKIILTKALDVIGTPVTFVCYKTSVVDSANYDLLKGETGEGVPKGGTTGQVLKKSSNSDYDAEWVDETKEVINSEEIEDTENNTYSANIIEKLLAGTTLYESTDFASTGTLSDNIKNYKRIKVYAKSGDAHNVVQEMLTSQSDPNGNLITSFWAGSIASINDGTYYGKTARLLLKDNTFTLNRYWSINLSKTPAINITENTSFTILKIVGYKY